VTPSPQIFDEPLRLPASAAPAPPASFPLVSAIAPVAGALVLWLVTGSPAMLWFAALGPLLALGGMVDGRRGARRSRRRGARERAGQIARLREEITDRHERERRRLWSRHPDVAFHLGSPDETWRAVPQRGQDIVVGRGGARSEVRLEGGDDASDAGELRAIAREVSGAPVRVPLTSGVAVVGPVVLAASVARAIALQVCLNLPPGRVQVADTAEWAHGLPHARAAEGDLLALVPAGEPVPADAAIPIVVVGPESPPPPRCGAILTLLGPATARLDHGDASERVAVEAVSSDQARRIVEMLADRAAATHGQVDQPSPPLHELLNGSPQEASRGASLPALIGTHGAGPAEIDIVAEGPHAVVIGVTGSGKSELLITWVASLAARHAPGEVSFLLVDFKGGRAFDALAALPHVTGVLTDLDDAAALRAIESLRAELRHRERVLGELSARDVSEAGGALPRLIVVVDEYAALVATHPALHDLFGDIAARGRALGVHLVLASQRAAGVFRDAVLANAPLRVSLRVTDAADSRAVLGVDDAAALSGRSDDRGVCLVRGAADVAPRRIRVARCAPGDVAALAMQGPPSRRPWLPPLPERIPLEAVSAAAAVSAGGALAIGVADEPDRQRQRPLILDDGEPGLVVLGAAGSGRSAVLRALAAQAADLVAVPSTPEEGWDAVGDAERAPRGAAIVIDDLDLLLARLPHDHATALRERIERLAREARARGVRLIVSAQRPAGPVARVVDAIPSRLLLAHASRADYVAAGGAAADFLPLPPGRGHLGGVLVQTPWTAEPDPAVTSSSPSVHWHPSRQAVAYVTPAGRATRAVLAAWADRGADVVSVDEPGAQLRRGGVVWGSPESWLGQWRLLSAARTDARLVVDAACGTEYRAITGASELPPYALPGAGRAWLCVPGGTVSRILLPPPPGGSQARASASGAAVRP